MRRLLAAAVLLAFMPSVHAQDKGKSDFSHDAEFRLRDTFEQNESGSTNNHPAHHNGVDERFKLDLKFKANEKFSATATMLQSASFGQQTDSLVTGTPTNVGNRGAVNGGQDPNVMTINQAYVSWMMSDALHANVGRMNFGFGDGSVMSVNDWQMQPYAFDGLTANYEMEFGRFTGFAFKYRDLANTTSTFVGAATSDTSDPQHDAYGLVFDLKTMPEWLKMVSAHVIQDTSDGLNGATFPVGATSPGAASTLLRSNSLRYGATAAFGMMGIDAKASMEMVGGKNSEVGTATADRTIASNMYQVEVGYSLPNFMSSRVWVSYHRDSGASKDDLTAATAKDTTYDGYFYDRHNGSGLMELVAWGNLTDTSVGATLKPMDSTEVGLGYHMLAKTSGDDATMPGTYGGSLMKGTTQTSGSKNIGNELDVWAEHKYDGGLSMLARVGYFTEGAWLKDASNNYADGSSRSDSLMQFSVQGKLTF